MVRACFAVRTYQLSYATAADLDLIGAEFVQQTQADNVQQSRHLVPSRAIGIVSIVESFNYKTGIGTPSFEAARCHELKMGSIKYSNILFRPIAFPENFVQRFEVQHVGDADNDPPPYTDAFCKGTQGIPCGRYVFENVGKNQSVQRRRSKRMSVTCVDYACRRKARARNVDGSRGYVDAVYYAAIFDEYRLARRRSAADRAKYVAVRGYHSQNVFPDCIRIRMGCHAGVKVGAIARHFSNARVAKIFA